MKTKDLYEKSLTELNLLKEEVIKLQATSFDLKEKLDQTSIFKISDISKILIKLLKNITNENYYFKSCFGDEYKIKYDIHHKEVGHQNVFRYYIIKEGYRLNTNKPIDSSLALTKDFILLKSIELLSDPKEIENINLNKFLNKEFPEEINFIKEFISYLIQCRIDNDLIEISLEQLEKILINYLEDKDKVKKYIKK